MALNKRIWRVLFENKSQYFGSVVLIIFTTFMFTLMTHFALNFERLANEFQDAYMQEDATFTTGRSIQNLAELELAAGAVIEEGASLDFPLSPGQTLRIFSQNDRLNLPAILQGRGLSASGEILISPAFAATNGYEIGDALRIVDQSYTITGFVGLPNYMYILQSETDVMAPPGFGIAVISKQDFAALEPGNRFYAVKFNHAVPSSPARSVQFRELLTSRGIEVLQWTDIDDNRRVSIVAAEVEILNLISKGIPSAILVLVIILTGNIVRRLIDRDAAIIGTLFALGYTRKEISRHYLMFPLFVAMTGGVVGTILGTIPIRSGLAFFAGIFNVPVGEILFSPLRIILSLFLPVFFLQVSAYFVLRNDLQHSPVELMRGKEEKNKVNFLERALKLEKFKFSTKFKIREQLRSLSRLAFLLFGIAVATMLLLWGFALKSGFDYMLTSGLTGTYHFVYEYKFDNPRFEPLPAGAEPFSAALFLAEGNDNRDFYVSGVMPHTAMLTLVDEAGDSLVTDRVIITKPLAHKLKIAPGDTINIVRKLDWRTFSIQIDSIADSYVGNFIFMPLADFNQKFELPEESYTGAFSNVTLNIPASQGYSVVSLEDKIAGIREAIAPTQSMTAVLATLAFIIGMIVIYVVTSMIVEENKNIISLMKIFGYRKKEINSLILNSSTFVVVIGYLLGIPLILAALGVLIQSMENSVGLALPPGRISPLYLLFGFIVVMLSYEVSKLLCVKKVDQVSMGEALKTGTE